MVDNTNILSYEKRKELLDKYFSKEKEEPKEKEVKKELPKEKEKK